MEQVIFVQSSFVIHSVITTGIWSSLILCSLSTIICIPSFTKYSISFWYSWTSWRAFIHSSTQSINQSISCATALLLVFRTCFFLDRFFLCRNALAVITPACRLLSYHRPCWTLMTGMHMLWDIWVPIFDLSMRLFTTIVAIKVIVLIK